MCKRPLVLAAVVLLAIASLEGRRQPTPGFAPAVAVDATTATLDAFQRHSLVAIGDAHGNVQGEAFQLALVNDARFPQVVNDILVEMGNSRHQDIVDRFIRGEDVAAEALQRVWLDTTQQHIAVQQVPALFTAVRAINAALPEARRLRILLGEPPIDWERIRTAEDLRQWESEPLSSRDRFAVELIRKEALAKNRKVLALYGAGHLFRKVVTLSLVTLFEAEHGKAFTIWTNAAAEMSTMQADVTKWPAPSLIPLRGTQLGQIDIAEFMGPSGKDIPAAWRAPMQEQFDAVLYLGPLSQVTLRRPPPLRCSDPTLLERLRRVSLSRPPLAERMKKDCER